MTAVIDARRDAEVPRLAAPPRRRTGAPLLDGDWRRAGGLVVALMVLGVVVMCSIAFGAKSIPFGTVWQALVDGDGSTDHQIVRELRVPRTLLGLGVGGALGLAGAMMQGVTRNPLADPGLLGVDAGAALAVVIGIHTFGVTSLTGYVWFAFAGAGLASVVVYLLGSVGRGGATPVKLALAGRRAHRAAHIADVGGPAARRADARRVPVLGGRLARRTRCRGGRPGRPVPRRGRGAGPGVVAGPEHAVARRRHRPVARPAGPPDARPVGPVDRAAVRGGHGGRRPDRVRRAHRASRGPGHLRPRLQVDPALVARAGADAAAHRRRRGAPRSPGRARCRWASSPRSSARRSSSRSCAAGSWPTCDRRRPPRPRRLGRAALLAVRAVGPHRRPTAPGHVGARRRGAGRVRLVAGRRRVPHPVGRRGVDPRRPRPARHRLRGPHPAPAPRPGRGAGGGGVRPVRRHLPAHRPQPAGQPRHHRRHRRRRGLCGAHHRRPRRHRLPGHDRRPRRRDRDLDRRLPPVLQGWGHGLSPRARRHRGHRHARPRSPRTS